ncbi:DUF1616 domain-containing protein [Halorussus amylolyticus]|uniref:DUF1616 domain-containing protein n=1 Tax=Halorussus amylolyticus TaxID=1126242 RepID=UPI00104B6A46|nr:DUF1616 domain-containing protein [Halorussus amylolyticus]
MSLDTAAETWLERLTRPAVAIDLLALVSYVAVAAVVLSQPGVYRTPVAVAMGLPLLFFAPGYALVSALFPGATPDDAPDDWTLADAPRHGLGMVERAALGFGVSVALLPVLGIALAASPWPIAPATVLFSVAALVVACAVVAAVRRARRPADRRFSLPVRAWVADARRGVRGGSLGESALNVGLALAVVVALATVGFAVAVPGPDQSYTDAYLLSQNETGELVAEDYPQNFTTSESRPIVVGLDNHEGETVEYTVVAQLQRVRQADDGSARVVQDRDLARFTPTVGPNESWQTRHDVTPTMTGEELRLAYLVYDGDPPDDPSTENADEHVHVWVNVTE